MPRYFFHVVDGQRLQDDTGIELHDIGEAQLEAIQLPRRVITDDAILISKGDDWRLEVTDHMGLRLFRFDFISGKPAA